MNGWLCHMLINLIQASCQLVAVDLHMAIKCLLFLLVSLFLERDGCA